MAEDKQQLRFPALHTGMTGEWDLLGKREQKNNSTKTRMWSFPKSDLERTAFLMKTINVFGAMTLKITFEYSQILHF